MILALIAKSVDELELNTNVLVEIDIEIDDLRLIN